MSLTLYPIGYVASDNQNSMGAWTDGGTAENLVFEPNNGANKSRIGHTLLSNMENRSLFARKLGEYRHTFSYNYEDIWSHEYNQIKRFVTDIAQHRANDFYMIDFSSGIKVTALASTGGNFNASIYDTSDFTATSGEGGNHACLWNGHNRTFRIGIISSYEEDSSFTFPQSTDYGNLASTLATDQVFAYPVYRVYLANDEEEFRTTTFVRPIYNASFAGAVRSGTVRFIQYDTK